MRTIPLVALVGFLAGCGKDGGATKRDAAVPDAGIDDADIPTDTPLGFLDSECAGQPGRPRVLVYSYENLWRHLSNWYARSAIMKMCESHGFMVQTTNDPHAINATRLGNVDVVVFAVTSGNGLSRASRDDLEAWIRAGGGYVGFEAAAATERDWPFYAQNLGAEFLTHSPEPERALVTIDTSHPITQGLASSFRITEQWYVFKNRPEEVPGLKVLLALDESTLPADYPEEMRVGYHPIGWAHEPFGGRVFYTGLGDLVPTFEDPLFLEITARAIEWAAHAR